MSPISNVCDASPCSKPQFYCVSYRNLSSHLHPIRCAIRCVSACPYLLTGPHLHSPVKGAAPRSARPAPRAPRPAFWFPTIWFSPCRLSGIYLHPPGLLLICCWLALINAFFDVSAPCYLRQAAGVLCLHVSLSLLLSGLHQALLQTPAYRVYLCTDFTLSWCTVERRIMCNASGSSLASSTMSLQ